MNYLAIDLHKNQITVNMRNEEGTVLFKKQISTHHNKIDEFFKGIAEQSANQGGFMAIYEICGFGHWLSEKLNEYGCKEIVVVQPDRTATQKTDYRDAYRRSYRRLRCFLSGKARQSRGVGGATPTLKTHDVFYSTSVRDQTTPNETKRKRRPRQTENQKLEANADSLELYFFSRACSP